MLFITYKNKNKNLMSLGIKYMDIKGVMKVEGAIWEKGGVNGDGRENSWWWVTDWKKWCTLWIYHMDTIILDKSVT